VDVVVALLFLAAVVLLVVAWLLTVRKRPSYGLCILGAACALLAYSLPAVTAGFGGT